MGNHLAHKSAHTFKTCDVIIFIYVLQNSSVKFEMLKTIWFAGYVLKCVNVLHSLYFFYEEDPQERKIVLKNKIFNQKEKKEVEIIVVNSNSIFYPKCRTY